MKVIAFATLFLLLAMYAMADVTPDGKMPWVLDLEKIPENPSKPYFVEFYSPFCAWCKKVANVYRVFGGYMRDSNIEIAKINCAEHPDECDKVSVEGYPTFKLFQTKNGKTETSDYAGHRTIDNFVKFIEEKVGKGKIGKLQEVDRKITSEKELTETIKRPKTFKLISITAEWCGHCKKLHPIWEALSLEILGSDFKIDIANVDGANEQMKQALKKNDIEVRGFPTILFFDQDGNKASYSGARTLKGFIEFLRDKTGYDIPIPVEEPTAANPSPAKADNVDSNFLAARYYENLARISLENTRLIRELQSQMDESLLLMRSVANVELPEEVQRKIDERKQHRETEKEKEKEKVEKIKEKKKDERDL